MRDAASPHTNPDSVVSPILELIPQRPTPKSLTLAAQGCTACELYRNATQAVCGEGKQSARMMLIGEAPGHEEDLRGQPFVGPAGRLLHDMLDEAGFQQGELYLTNAVKHFKWEARGTRRLHVKPSYKEVAACRPWLDVELEMLKPRVVVCLGASAAQSFRGPGFRVTQHLGEISQTADGAFWMATLHPAAVLRMPSPETRQHARATVVKDLQQARELLKVK